VPTTRPAGCSASLLGVTYSSAPRWCSNCRFGVVQNNDSVGGVGGRQGGDAALR
jgi:hypothetical protein